MMATAYNSADWTMEALANHYEKSEFADIAYKIGANL